MSDDNRRYHEAAVKYNEGLAECAEKLATTLQDPTVKKWCEGVGRQHRHHAERHQRALDKMGDMAHIPDEPAREKTIEEEQAAFAAAQEENNA